MRTALLLAVIGSSLLIGGCGERPAPLRGTVHCGPVQRCTGQEFLIYTALGGKVIRVAPTPTRTHDDIARMLRDGAPVEILGIPRADWTQHHHVVPADRIRFPDA
jgi:hypothetical protein